MLAAYFTLATRPGRPWAEIFRGAVDLYRDLGWPGEWELHHQGGPTGYRARDLVATPEAPGVVSPHQATAWNPSITGTKSEDTLLVDAAGHEFLTRHGEWPMVPVTRDGRTLEFAGVLVP
jgi:antitoxin VapB